MSQKAGEAGVKKVKVLNIRFDEEYSITPKVKSNVKKFSEFKFGKSAYGVTCGKRLKKRGRKK